MNNFNEKSIFSKSTIRRTLTVLLIAAFHVTTFAQSVNCNAVKTASSDARDKKLGRISNASTNQRNANKSALDCLAALNSLLNSTIPTGSINGLNVPSLNSIIDWLAKKSCAVVLAEARNVTRTVVNGVTQPIEGLVTLANGGVRMINGTISDSSGKKLAAGTPFEYLDINGNIMVSTVQDYINTQPLSNQSPVSPQVSVAAPLSNNTQTSNTSNTSPTNPGDTSIWSRVSCALIGGQNCN